MYTIETLKQGFVLRDRIVQPAMGIIVCDGRAHHLAPLSMALMCLLAGRHGQLVERDDIIDLLWPDRRISHQTLARHVGEIRRCLDDDARRPQFIETVPRKGYRLIAPLVAEQELVDRANRAAHGSTHGNANTLTGFLHELRQRKVVRAALLYIVVVWATLQVGEIVFPALGLPDWTLTFLVLLGILGFPIVMVLAWVFELTPTGLALDVAMTPGLRRTRREKLHIVAISGLLVVVVLLGAQLMMRAGASAPPASVPVACEQLPGNAAGYLADGPPAGDRFSPL